MLVETFIRLIPFALELRDLLFFLLFRFDVDQGVSQAPVDAPWSAFRHRITAHVTFQRDACTRFLEKVTGRARTPAEGTLAVFLTIDYHGTSAIAFSIGVISGQYRNIDVILLIPEDTDS